MEISELEKLLKESTPDFVGKPFGCYEYARTRKAKP
jgi:hypothetical protein